MRTLALLVVLILIYINANPTTSAVSRNAEPARVDVRVSDLLDFGRSQVRTFALCGATRRLLVSHGTKDDALYQWDVDRHELEHTYHVGAGFFCDFVALSPDGRFAVVGCYPVRTGEPQVGPTPLKTLLLDTVMFATVRDLALDVRIFDVRFGADGGRFLITSNAGAR